MLESLASTYHTLSLFRVLIAVWCLCCLYVGYCFIMAAADPELPLDTTAEPDKMLVTGPKGHGDEQGGDYLQLSPGSRYQPRYVIRLLSPYLYLTAYHQWTVDERRARTFEFMTSAIVYAECTAGLRPGEYQIERLPAGFGV